MYEYRDITMDEIDHIRELWYKNRDFHQSRSAYFSADYDHLKFEDRMEKIAERSKQIRITVAEDEKAKPVAYCLSMVSESGDGEIATLFVDENFRKQGIGRYLLEQHLQWFSERGIDSICVEVLYDNDAAIDLYKSVGFVQDTTRMRVPARRGAQAHILARGE